MLTTPSQKSVSGGDHLLIIRFSAMGDVAMLAPVLRILVATYPNLQITVLTRGFFAPIFKGIPRIEIHAADLKGKHKGIIGLLRLSKELKKRGITAVGDMHNVLRSNILKMLFLLSNIKFLQIDKGRAEKKALTSTKNKVFRQLKSTHQRYADVLTGLGYPIDLSRPVFPEINHPSSEIIKLTGRKDVIWIGVAPFAAHASKAYPTTLLAEVLQKLSAEKELKIFLFGGGAVESRKLESFAAGYENITSVAGKFKFDEELELISNLDLMVSMDSGNAHLAAMYGVKVLTIWGVTHPYAGFAAYNQPEHHHLLADRNKYPAIPTSVYGNKSPEGYEHVMETIKPQAIVERIKNMVSKTNG